MAVCNCLLEMLIEILYLRYGNSFEYLDRSKLLIIDPINPYDCQTQRQLLI